MSVDIRKLMQVDDKGTQRQYYPETNIEAINGLEDLLINGDYPELERTIYQFEGNVSETSQRLNRLKTEMSEMVEGEHDFLTPEKGFENYHNDGTVEDEESERLQYVRIGPICHIYGSIRNLGTLEKDSEVVVATLPYRLAIFMRDVKVSQGSSNNTFTAYARSINNNNNSNQIIIARFRDNDGNSTNFNAGKWLNISLTVGVEVIQ
ncbi:hypothetical protein LQF60_02890 [Tetragenococcus koreensis]|uniref:hypothetical protein n=1 Tax=Tetragenococcus koreensis TaxID=290335 RepID=UPI001F3942A4|nr:hypothetical protein [Tetragenococcus koreensis]MCF1585240.1 hypothetical protein [Tetragenococcus koreensis]MCF1628784.1 hypothetical protein [Tetragenococcus koreensis]